MNTTISETAAAVKPITPTLENPGPYSFAPFFHGFYRVTCEGKEITAVDVVFRLNSFQANYRSLYNELIETRRQRDEALAAIELGQINCDEVYDDLRAERDQLLNIASNMALRIAGHEILLAETKRNLARL